MKLIKGGIFNMGDIFEDVHYLDERPVHSVTVDDFYMAACCITFEEYDAFCDATGRRKPYDEDWGRNNRPVINVSWLDAVEYCNWLSQQEKLTPVYIITSNKITTNQEANGYRLPTEAEWEFAARGGVNSQNYIYAGSNDLHEVGWYGGNSHQQTKPVGQKKPNELGIYDMSGNVWEWCSSLYKSYPYKADDGRENLTGTGSYVLRGGSWACYAQYCRVANRDYDISTYRDSCYGFRIVRNSKN